MDIISGTKVGVFSVYAHEGTGKSYMWRTICVAISNIGEIVLPFASSGVASILLPRGKIAPLIFNVPLNVSEKSTCVSVWSRADLATLLIKTKLIIWDETYMLHKYCLEALDRSLKDIMRSFDDVSYIDLLAARSL